MRCKEILAETIQKLSDQNKDLKTQLRGWGKYERDCDGMATEIRWLNSEVNRLGGLLENTQDDNVAKEREVERLKEVLDKMSFQSCCSWCEENEKIRNK